MKTPERENMDTRPLARIVKPSLQGLLSPKLLAEFLGKSPDWVYQANSAGTGPPFYRVGGEVRYDLDAVLDWLKSKEVRRGGPE